MNAADALPPPWVADLIATRTRAAVDAALAPIEALAAYWASDECLRNDIEDGQGILVAVDSLRAAVKQGRAAGVAP